MGKNTKLKLIGIILVCVMIVIAAIALIPSMLDNNDDSDNAFESGWRKPGDNGMKFIIPGLWWRQLASTESGELAYWDTEWAAKFSVNWLSTSYRPLENGSYYGTSWVIPPGMIENVMEIAKPGLESAHKAGILIAGCTDTMQFNPEVYRKAGIDPSLYYGKNANGKNISIEAWQKGNYMSCLNNPHWQELECKVAEETAKAGFDSLFLDLFPYTSGAGVLCNCEYCKSEWKEYSTSVYGAEKPLPATALRMTDSVNRTFLKWRISAIYNFMQKLEKAGQKYNENFVTALNCNGDNPCMAYLLYLGMKQPTSELGQITAGDESSLYIYRVIEAMSKDPLLAQFNTAAQYTPLYKYKTELAEAYAGGGALMLALKNVDTADINKQFVDFLNRNKPAFDGSESVARVGILFSWRDHTFLQSSTMEKTDRMTWDKNSARRVASMLAARGIPYDYVIVENNLKNQDLSKYDVLIAPELKLLDDKDAAILHNYMKKGGSLLALGAFAALKSEGEDYISRTENLYKKWSRNEMADGYVEGKVGKGKLVGVPIYATGSNERILKGTKEFEKAYDYIELNKQMKIENRGNGRIESTVRKNGNILYINLIRYADNGINGETDIKVTFRLPQGADVKSVKCDSPYLEEGQQKMTWNVENGELIVVAKHEIYTLLSVEL